MKFARKKLIVIPLIILAGLVFLLLITRPASNKSWKGKTIEKISYSDISESDYLDLYLPESNESLPLIILVHGGGFFTGDSKSKETTYMIQFFRRNGYACASVNYRLSGEDIYPAAIEDVQSAVKYLHEYADEYGLDESRFFIWGESAGAYLATMATVSGEDIGVRALVDFYGPMNFYEFDQQFDQLGLPVLIRKIIGNSTDGYTDTFDSPESIFMGQAIGTLSDEQKNYISPETYVERFAASNPEFRVYIRHGKLDITVPYLQSVNLADEFTKALGDSQVNFSLYSTYKHADRRFYTEKNLENLLDFLNNIS